ncbi:hypothetical protein [Pasteurella sp. PK-2025]|uniref:hypothetical protein n=1 Tax=Pasteurella sp. PK-2025 TaxID=3413133 RepID=UPI003C7915B0
MSTLKEDIKEDLEAILENYGVDHKGKLDEIAEDLATTFEMINELKSYSYSPCYIDEENKMKRRIEQERELALREFLMLPICNFCNGTGKTRVPFTLAEIGDCPKCGGRGRT